jgi:hypothetical protein
MRIISGGQTGVDRAALDVAIELGIPCGGWCPAGRRAEDGPIHPRYPLRETPEIDPAQRTAWNVLHADATLILSPLPLGGGTLLARRIAHRRGKPYLVAAPDPSSTEVVRDWLDGFPLRAVLNVAGPRESEAPGIYFATSELLRRVIQEYRSRHAGRGG